MTTNPDERERNENEAPPPPDSVEGLFLRALRKPDVEARLKYLRESCVADDAKLNRVLALLSAYDDSGSFLDSPAHEPSSALHEVPLDFLNATDKEGCLGTLGPYDILDVIGRGGMGIVLRAFDAKLSRVVAIKVLLPALASSINARRRFLREARAAAAISHPHVVTIHAVEEQEILDTGGSSVPPYLVMECVVGQSLQQKLDQIGPLPLDEILRISRQVAEGLAAAHQQGLIHRDIKPANILLENGVERVKITDFGLARAIDDITVTRTGEVSGTPQYMSPEQANGEQVDHRSDVFSLGCVMYAMCTGHSPFRSKTLAHVIKRVTQDAPRSITEQNPDIPMWSAQIVDRLLQKDPNHRVQTTDELVSLLDKHLTRRQHASSSESHSVINEAFAANAADPKTDETLAAHLARPTRKADLAFSSGPQAIQRQKESVHGRTGRFLIHIGVFCALVPLLFILAGSIATDGDLMEFGGMLALPGMILGGCAVAIGYVLRYIIDGSQELHHRLHLWWPALAAFCLVGLGTLLHQIAEKNYARRQAIRQRINGQRSEIISPVIDPSRAVLTINHPPLEIRKLSLNRGGSTIARVSSTQTKLLLDPEHLGTRIQCFLVAQDGRQRVFYHAIQREKDAITLGEEDFRAGAHRRALVEVVDDVPDVELRMVNFPSPWLPNRTLDIREAPFHALLGPVEQHAITIVCLPNDAPPNPKAEDFVQIQHDLVVEGTDPIKLSLQELLKEHHASD